MQGCLNKILVLILMVGSFAPLHAHAEDQGVSDDLNVIEMELDKSAPRTPPPSANTTPRINEAEDKMEAQQNSKISDFSGLGKLAPFSEISVLQKRFLPKTNRWQFTGAFAMITNNPWFLTAGVSLKVAYYFTEAWGIEGTYSILNSSERQSAQELYSNHNVTADSFGFPKNYMIADAKYTPFYGKMTWLNQHIIPFEHYITAGLGNTSISTGGSAPTFHIGTGQNFAMSKRFSVNWDLSNMIYSGNGNSYSDILATVGVSFFYPEASYR